MKRIFYTTAVLMLVCIATPQLAFSRARCDQKYPHECCGPDFRPFMRDLQKNIKRAWKVRGQRKRRVVVCFKAHENRTISELRIDESSGSSSYDQKALEAIRSANIPEFPMDAPDFVEIKFTFSSKL